MQYNEEFWNKYADENESRYNEEFSKYIRDLASSLPGIQSVLEIGCGTGKMGSVTKALQKSFTDVVMGKDERFLPWLTFS